MTSRPGSPPTTKANPDLLIDFLDIVATQGAYLVPRAGTPVVEKDFEDKFVAELVAHLDAVVTEQICRTAMYHGAADEWPMGRTPPEIREKRKAELKALEELEGATSDDGSDSDGDEKGKGGNDFDTQVGPGKSVATPDRPRRPPRPPQVDWLPTPPLSVESPLNTSPHRRKRRRTSGEDDEEKARPVKKHASAGEEASAAAEDAAPNMSQQKGRKRRRDFAAGGGEEGDKERPSKVRVTTTRSNNTWLRRLRPRPKPPRPKRPAG